MTLTRRPNRPDGRPANYARIADSIEEAESASTPHELIDMAATAVMDRLPRVAFTSVMSKSSTNDCWLHRSAVYPDVAKAINQLAPIDDRVIQKAKLEHEGLSLVGSYDYGTASIAHLRDRDAHTDLRSGFGVCIPLTDGILGFCRKERGAPDTDHILFLGSISSILALTMRGSSFSPDEPPAPISANGRA